VTPADTSQIFTWISTNSIAVIKSDTPELENKKQKFVEYEAIEA